MRELAQSLSEINPGKWKELSHLPLGRVRQILLALDIADLVMDYIILDNGPDAVKFSEELDKLIVKHF